MALTPDMLNSLAAALASANHATGASMNDDQPIATLQEQVSWLIKLLQVSINQISVIVLALIFTLFISVFAKVLDLVPFVDEDGKLNEGVMLGGVGCSVVLLWYLVGFITMGLKIGALGALKTLGPLAAALLPLLWLVTVLLWYFEVRILGYAIDAVVVFTFISLFVFGKSYLSKQETISKKAGWSVAVNVVGSMGCVGVTLTFTTTLPLVWALVASRGWTFVMFFVYMALRFCGELWLRRVITNLGTFNYKLTQTLFWTYRTVAMSQVRYLSLIPEELVDRIVLSTLNAGLETAFRLYWIFSYRAKEETHVQKLESLNANLNDVMSPLEENGITGFSTPRWIQT
eukprot:CAMPEP_0114571718 /NCGR_PEP_ID=MMETSP0114-20121206/17890_1 /TAXON_ID=31324 /ORGANISM="Goniomonas sp, Strain m" /LENGTH=344 /DNA_ID=CAMNT_0001758845 /DNA_START=430 /DNA_END=1460 /DNA_ORIENTATION=+